MLRKKNTQVKKRSKKIERRKNLADFKKYATTSLIFALMMTIFNHIYMILSLYTTKCYGLYMFVFDDLYLNVIFNTIFDVIFFFLIFNIYSYIFLEMLLLPKEKSSRMRKKRV